MGIDFAAAFEAAELLHKRGRIAEAQLQDVAGAVEGSLRDSRQAEATAQS